MTTDEMIQKLIDSNWMVNISCEKNKVSVSLGRPEWFTSEPYQACTLPTFTRKTISESLSAIFDPSAKMD